MTASERSQVEGVARGLVALQHMTASILSQCQTILDSGSASSGNVDAPPIGIVGDAGESEINPRRFGRATPPRREG